MDGPEDDVEVEQEVEEDNEEEVARGFQLPFWKHDPLLFAVRGVQRVGVTSAKNVYN